MRKIIIVLCLLVSGTIANGQEIGVRFGDAIGGNVAVDMVLSIGDFSRVHADVSFGSGLGIEALYDMIYRPLGEAEGFYWYVGVGPFIDIDDPFQMGVSGEIGLEYRFDFPLVIGADYRPSFRIVEDTDFLWDGFGLNVRWDFGAPQ